MGFWDKIFPKKKQTEEQSDNYMWNYLDGTVPIYTSDNGRDIYASDVVLHALYSIVFEMMKLDMTHIKKGKSGDVTPVNGEIQSVLENPNPLMTQADYLSCVSWLLLTNYNAVVYPYWEAGKLKALYPLRPINIEFQIDDAGNYYVEMRFKNGYKVRLPYSTVIHLRYRYGANEYMGGGVDGKPDYKALVKTLKINDTMVEGLAKALNIQTSINGVVKIKTMLNKEDQMKEIAEFEKKLRSNSSGMLPLDISSEYIPISKQVNLVDNNVLEFLDRKVLRYWGVSIPIVNGDYTKEQYEAFYQKAIEPLVKVFTQAHTKGIFTGRAAHGFGNQIAFYPQDLIFLNTSQKLEMVRMLGDSGSIYENEKRTAFGLKPLPELVGVRMQSLNYVNVEDASRYQVGDNSSNKDDTSNEDDSSSNEDDEGVNGNEE